MQFNQYDGIEIFFPRYGLGDKLDFDIFNPKVGANP